MSSNESDLLSEVIIIKFVTIGNFWIQYVFLSSARCRRKNSDTEQKSRKSDDLYPNPSKLKCIIRESDMTCVNVSDDENRWFWSR